MRKDGEKEGGEGKVWKDVDENEGKGKEGM